MVESEQFFDIFFIYHPDDIVVVRRIAAQLKALGLACRFDEDEFSGRAVDIGLLKADVLRSHAVAIVLSPVSAASQLCNELIQHAVTNSKRIVSMILNDDIDVEVHPAVADNPYVFFREQDHLADRVEEARQYMAVDYEVRLHTELLVAADRWQRRGRRPSQLLPPERVMAARQWLANDTLRTVKPSPLLVEYIHSSRRQRAPSGPTIPFARLSLALLLIILLIASFFVLRAALDANAAAQAAAAQTSAARAQVALTSAAATAASDSAVGLVDVLAATSESIGVSVSQTAQAEAAAATQAAYATQTAQAIATQARATEVYALARDADALRLIRAAEAALEASDGELALALAWTAKDALEDPQPAYRVMRQAISTGASLTLEDVALLEFQPGGGSFALVQRTAAKLQIFDSANWTLKHELDDSDAPITALAYSPDGTLLVTGSADGEVVIRVANSGTAIHRLERHQAAVTALAFAPTGSTLYSAGSDPTLVAWDSETSDELAVFESDEGDAAAIKDLLATADGGRIIGRAGDDVIPQMRQWTADTLELISDNRVYRGYDGGGRIGYSGGRSLPAYPGDPDTGDLTLWDLTTGERIAPVTEGFKWSLQAGGDLTAVTDELLFISFHEDRALVGVRASDGGQRAVLIDASNGSLIRSFDGKLAASLANADFIDAATLLSATQDDRLILWSSADGTLIRQFAAAPQTLAQVEVSADANTVVGGSADGSAFLWSLSDRQAEPAATFAGTLPGTGLSPSGATMLLVEESGATLRQIDTDEIISQYHASLVSKAGARFATYQGDLVSVHDFETGETLHSWSADWDDPREMHLSRDGELLLAQADGQLWLLRAAAESPMPLNTRPPSQVAFAVGGANFATVHAQHVLLWDAASGAALGAYPLGDVSADKLDLAFSPDGEKLYFFVRLPGGLAGLTAVAIADNSVRRRAFLDVAYGELSPDGEFLLLALGDGRFQIVGTETGDILHTLSVKASAIQSLRLLPELGLLLASSGSDMTVWDTAAAAIDQQFVSAHPLVDFSHSGDAQRFLTRDARGLARLWQVESPAELLRRIEAEHPPRDLTCAERERYLVLPLCE